MVRRKYGNKPNSLDGRNFDSKAEMQRYAQLRLFEKQGWISDLRCQPRYPLRVNGTLVCTYIADFEYRAPDGTMVVEDVKSPATITQAFRLKEKLMQAVHGIKVHRYVVR